MSEQNKKLVDELFGKIDDHVNAQLAEMKKELGLCRRQLREALESLDQERELRLAISKRADGWSYKTFTKLSSLIGKDMPLRHRFSKIFDWLGELVLYTNDSLPLSPDNRSRDVVGKIIARIIIQLDRTAHLYGISNMEDYIRDALNLDLIGIDEKLA